MQNSYDKYRLSSFWSLLVYIDELNAKQRYKICWRFGCLL